MIFNFTVNRRRTLCAASVFIFMGLVHAAPARADRRAYAETYEAVTAPQGGLDVELWTTYARDGEVPNGSPSRGFRNMIELEYGITDRWDVALYNLIDIVDSSTNESGYAGLKVETRYRLAPAHQWIVDPVLYFEYQFLRHGDAAHKAEIKLILARDIEQWNIALNLAAEVERLRTAQYVPEVEYALGVSREFGPSFKLGAEIFGKAEKPPGEATETFIWAGPAASWAAGMDRGGLHGLWVTVGAGRGLTSHSDAWYGRLIVGLQF